MQWNSSSSHYSQSKRSRVLNQAKQKFSWTNVLNSSQPIDCKRLTVPIGLPVYRLENGRTEAHQKSYIFLNEKNENFFSDIESKEAQWVQHNILLNMIGEDGSSVVKTIGKEDESPTIYREIKKNRQTEPIMITGCFTSNPEKSGMILNGNRRLAVLRHMGIEEVDVFILPDHISTETQFNKIEEILQNAEETKKDYNWVNHCRRLRVVYQEACGSDEEQFKEYCIKVLNKADAKESKQDVEIARELDKYLKFIGQPNNFSLVMKEKKFKQVFKDIAAAKINNNANDKDEFRHFAYITMMNNWSPEGISINKILANCKKVMLNSSVSNTFYEDDVFNNIDDKPNTKKSSKNTFPEQIGGNPIVNNKVKRLAEKIKNKKIDNVKDVQNDITSRVVELIQEQDQQHEKDFIYNRFKEATEKVKKAKAKVLDFKHSQRINKNDINFSKKIITKHIKALEKEIKVIVSALEKETK